MTTWIALLRGINVGGRNKLAMTDLRASAESLGFTEVTTYIQSGNVLFDADGSEAAIAAGLAGAIADRHGLVVPVIVRPAADVEAALAGHPDAGGDIEPKLLHIAFLDRAPDLSGPSGGVEPDGFRPDRWTLTGRDLYLTYPDGSARSKMTIDRFEQDWGVTATGRNLNTVAKLAALARAR